MSARKIEDVIRDVLKGDTQVAALDFISYLRRKEIPFDDSENYWEVKYKDKCVCFILISGTDEKPGPWTIWSDPEPGTWTMWSDSDDYNSCADASVAEHIKETAWKYVNHCANCGGDCSPGQRKSVLGKSFDNLCSSAMAFTNPDAEALQCAKRMIDIRINDILNTQYSEDH